MTALTWDETEDREFTDGVDRGVLYLGGEGLAWNGLISVTRDTPMKVIPVYYDGQKIHDYRVPQSSKATIVAYTYPDEFEACQGLGEVMAGANLGEQYAQTFDLSWRTHLFDSEGTLKGRKIHILYNCLAVPAAVNFASIGETQNPINFSWSVTTTPEYYSGFRPSSYLTLDSSKLDAELFASFEDRLYGTSEQKSQLPRFQEMMQILVDFFAIEIIDNKDGTYTVRTNNANNILLDDNGEFRVFNTNATFPDGDSFVVSSTKE